MRCSAVEKRISVYVSDELPEQERRRIEAHLQRCANCKNEYDALVRTWSALRRWEDREPSPAFLHTVRERIARNEGREAYGRSIVDAFIRKIKQPSVYPVRTTVVRVAAVILLLLFTFGTHVQWATKESVWHLGKRPQGTSGRVREIRVNFNFLQVGLEETYHLPDSPMSRP